MTIKALQISETLLKPILQARSDLAGRPGARAEDQVGEPPAFGLAHPIHVMGLRDLVKGARIAETPAAIRVLESRGPDIVAFYDVSASGNDPQVMQIAGSDDGYAALLERGLDAATRWAADKAGETELRLLRIPALYTEALLLRAKGDKEETVIVIRTLQPVDALRPMPLSELMARLEAPARLILENDDGLKGS